MAALLTNARDFEGDEAMLRLRFYRAPPRAVARAAAGAPPIVFVVALADEHGDDASLPGVGVACGVEGGAAAGDVDVVALAPNRWRCSVAPAVLVAAAAATGRCRVVARATRDDPPLRDLDVLATSAAVELGECAEATPQFLATRHFAFRSVDAAVVEDFGAACGSHVWNAGRTRVIQRRFNVSVPRARVSETAPTLRERSERISLVQKSAETSGKRPR